MAKWKELALELAATGKELTQQIAQLEDELGECRKLAKSYIDAYEKFAIENGLKELEEENGRLREFGKKLDDWHLAMLGDVQEGGKFDSQLNEIHGMWHDALKEGADAD